MNREQIDIIAARTKLWQEFVAQYQAKMVMEPESFSDWCAEWRERFLAGSR